MKLGENRDDDPDQSFKITIDKVFPFSALLAVLKSKPKHKSDGGISSKTDSGPHKPDDDNSNSFRIFPMGCDSGVFSSRKEQVC